MSYSVNKPLFKKAFLLLCLIGALEVVAELFYLHWTVWWYDNMLHFLAGACIAIAALSFFSRKALSPLRAICIGVFFALFIGIVWEVFELYVGVTSLSDGQLYVFDTISDILMDLTGAFFASLYAYRKLKSQGNI